MSARHYPVRYPTSREEKPPEPFPSHDPRAFENERKEFGDNTVTVVVGSGEIKYLVHESLLCAHSPFFKAAVKKEWNGHETTISLPDDLPDVVTLYRQWMYQTRIFSRKSAAEAPGTTHRQSEIGLLVDAYVFGDKIQDGRFTDALLDAIIRSANTPVVDKSAIIPGGDAIEKAFAGTLAGSPLRRLMVDIWSRHAQSSWVTEGMPKDFITDLARSLLCTRPALTDIHAADGKGSTCSYHHHMDKACYSLSSEQAYLLSLI